jgi:SAM-dependent methyltransferase
MSNKERFYPESAFGGYTDIDGTVVFFGRVNALLQPDFTVLDVGCGRGSHVDDRVLFRKQLRTLQGKVRKVIGIDVDEAARENPFLDEFHLLTGEVWPVASDSIDLIVCDNVMEHVADPAGFFSEARRVLKDGGYLCIRTPNRWGYVAIAATLVPNRYHSRVTSAVQDGRKQEDVFPTLYRCNTVGKMRQMMQAHGLDAVVYPYEAEPSYLSFSRIAYFFGVLHQRYAPRFMKPALFAFGRMRKPAR